MKALVLIQKNSPVSYQEMPLPEGGTRKTIVALKAAALNHRDVWITKGKYPGVEIPTILGSDGAGTVNGKNVIINPNISWGTNPHFQSDKYRILGMPNNGTFAEYVAVHPRKLYDMPTHLSYEQAAALPLAGLTAYRAVFTKGQCTSDKKVLISGVGGGVALMAFQFAIATGAKVYVTSGSDEKLERAVQMGAVSGANYKVEKWSKDLKSQAGGFDLIIDSAGGTGFASLLHMAAPGARIVIYGGTQGYFAKLSPQVIFWKQLSILGTTMGTDEEFGAMVAFVEKHKIIPIVDSIYTLKDGVAAFERMDAGLQFGKMVLKIA